MSEQTIEQQLVTSLAARVKWHVAEIDHTLSALNPRERKLVREAAVMGYVRGNIAGLVGDRAIPKDSDVLDEVVGACLGMPDLYPTFAQMSRKPQKVSRS